MFNPKRFLIMDECLSVSLFICVQDVRVCKELRTLLFSQLFKGGRPLAVSKDDSTKYVAVSDHESSLI